MAVFDKCHALFWIFSTNNRHYSVLIRLTMGIFFQK